MPYTQLILNVDDTEAVRYAKTHTLRTAGFRVDEATNGTEALQKVAELRPGLVLLDVRLPDISGIEVCRRIKADFPSTMVLQISASYISTIDRVIGLENGADSYLAQPVEPAELIAAVRALLRMRAAEDQLRSTNENLEARVTERTRQLLETNLRLTQEIAEREKAEASLVQALKTEALGQLSGGIAHDFNNLLMIILSHLNLLAKRLPESDAKAQRYWTGAKEGAERAATLTQRLLAFARRQELKVESANVAALLENLRSLVERSVGPMIEVVMNVEPDLRPASVDRNQLELALLNLSVNGRDAMPEQGRLAISARNDRPAPGSRLAAGDYVVVSVADSGIGMDAATLARATEPFFSTKADKGTGLGLSMVHGFMEQLGGALKLSSAIGVGTTAELWLPAATASDQPEEQRSIDKGPLRPLSILFVDDEPLLLMAGVDMLESSGHRVTSANSGPEALAALQAGGPYDLLITDHAMPGMTGTELAEKALQTAPGIRVVLASGFQDLPSDAAKWTRLRKPYLESDLIELIHRLDAAGDMREV
ncbi:MAG TPA: response regulator [Dongiaceae bacterium]|jgi:signal transduction histidine kinase